MIKPASKPDYSRNAELNNFFNSLGEYCAKLEPCTVFITVIDNLAMLNSAYGHMGADNIIGKLCQKISLKNGATQRVADNCIVILQPGVNVEKNKAAANNLKKIISQFGLKSGRESAAHISSTVNYVEVSDFAKTPEEIFARLYAETGNRRNYSDEFPQTSRKALRAQMSLANEIYEALHNNRLQLAYQPLIEAKSGKLHSYECLLRIIDEHGKSSSAGTFIHVAEKMGIIENIDLYVLDMVMDRLEADKEIKLSFNLSNLSIGNAAWVKRFFERATAQIARRVTVEITETAAMLDLASTAYFIAKLQETGAQVALDDFGSGYTSFRQIRSLSLDYVKIDGSLIKDITTNHHNQLLVKSLLEFLQGLKLKTVAEFVDSADTAKFLINCGVDYMQGNYFGEARI